MKKLYNYTQFNVNEKNKFFSWINDNILNKLSGWSKEFFIWLKKGQIRTIESGSKKGKPLAMLFVPENGSIVEQLRNFSSMPHNEAVVPLTHPKYTNIGSADLKKEIIDYYNIKKTIAEYYDKPKDQRNQSDDIKGMKAKPIFIYGAPGIGKTEIVAACCDELKIPLLFLDVQFMNPEDFKGIPSVHNIREPKFSKEGGIEDTGSGFTRSNPPSMFPRDNGKDGRGGIIFMDELNRSQPNVLNTMMQFIQQGRIGEEYVLPNKWILVAAGNREEDDPDANIAAIGTAMASRMTIVNYIPNYNPETGGMDPEITEWKEWASKEMGIMPELVSYLTAHPDQYHKNDPGSGGAFPTPRSWTEASKILYSKLHINGKKSWRNVTDQYIKFVFSKEVGQTAATDFTSYLELLKKFSEMELNEILTNSDNVKIPDELRNDSSNIFGLGSLLYNRITDKELTSQAFNKVYNLLKYFYRVEGGNPDKRDSNGKLLNPSGKGERYSWLYKRFLEKWKTGNMLQSNQSNDSFTPKERKKRKEISDWTISFDKN